EMNRVPGAVGGQPIGVEGAPTSSPSHSVAAPSSSAGGTSTVTPVTQLPIATGAGAPPVIPAPRRPSGFESPAVARAGAAYVVGAAAPYLAKHGIDAEKVDYSVLESFLHLEQRDLPDYLESETFRTQRHDRGQALFVGSMSRAPQLRVHQGNTEWVNLLL